MKLDEEAQAEALAGRPPRGGRGLKSQSSRSLPSRSPSPPSRGAWIEMTGVPYICPAEAYGRPPRGGRGLKSFRDLFNYITSYVAPLAGGVD